MSEEEGTNVISTCELREKYATRRGPMVNSRGWTPAGSRDVLRLCEYADDLLEIVRWAQRQLPAEQQREVEAKLWAARIRT